MTAPAKLTTLFAVGRIAAGAALIASPDRLAARWLGDDAARPGPRLAIRALGARDIALGAGVLATLGDDRQLRRWVAASAGCDLADAMSALATPSSALPANARWATVAMGGGAALAGAFVHRALA
jgi:hypothetical protein